MHRTTHNRILVLAGLALTIASSAAGVAQAQNTPDDGRKTSTKNAIWRLSLGANYSIGNYGEAVDTTITSIPLALRYSRDRFSIRVSVPYIFLDGPGSLLDRPDGGGADVGDGTPRAEHRQGIGDVSVSATYRLPLGSGVSLATIGRIKLPTASRAKRLGTGKVDVTTGLELVKDFNGASVYVDGRRRFVGDPAGANLRDVWGVGAGASARVARGFSVGVDYGWRQSSRIGGGDISELSAWASTRLNKRLRVTISAGTGLTTNSSDFTGGTSLSYRL